MNDMEFARTVVDLATQARADVAEVAISKASEVRIEVKDGAPETVTSFQDSGFGVRVLVDGKMGFAASNRFDTSDAKRVVGDLVGMTKLHTADEFNSIPTPGAQSSSDGVDEVFDEVVLSTPLDRKVRRAVDIDIALRAAEERIRGAAIHVYGDEAQEMVLVNSLGVEGLSRTTYSYAFVWAIAQDGDATETGSHVEVSRTYDGLDTESVARTAAEHALRMLGAGTGHSAELPMIVPPEVGSELLAYLAQMLSADAVQKGKSLFAGRENTKVAADSVSIVDDGRLTGGLATSAVDGEGVPTQRTPLITNGVLRGLLHDSYTAKRGDTRSTGNAGRGGYRSKPSISTTNLLLEPSSSTVESLTQGMDEGFYITETQALHAAINPASGQFSIPCKGLMIRGGDLCEPVTNLAISGNLFDLLKDVDMVADDLTWTVTGGFIAAPTFRVGQVKIASGD